MLEATGTCFPVTQGSSHQEKTLLLVQPGQRATNKGADWQHLPYARGQGVPAWKQAGKLPRAPSNRHIGNTLPWIKVLHFLFTVFIFRPAKPQWYSLLSAVDYKQAKWSKTVCKYKCETPQSTKSFMSSDFWVSSLGCRLKALWFYWKKVNRRAKTSVLISHQQH